MNVENARKLLWDSAKNLSDDKIIEIIHFFAKISRFVIRRERKMRNERLNK